MHANEPVYTHIHMHTQSKAYTSTHILTPIPQALRARQSLVHDIAVLCGKSVVHEASALRQSREETTELVHDVLVVAVSIVGGECGVVKCSVVWLSVVWWSLVGGVSGGVWWSVVWLSVVWWSIVGGVSGVVGVGCVV
jgi:hypothetical protein